MKNIVRFIVFAACIPSITLAHQPNRDFIHHAQTLIKPFEKSNLTVETSNKTMLVVLEKLLSNNAEHSAELVGLINAAYYDYMVQHINKLPLKMAQRADVLAPFDTLYNAQNKDLQNFLRVQMIQCVIEYFTQFERERILGQSQRDLFALSQKTKNGLLVSIDAATLSDENRIELKKNTVQFTQSLYRYGLVKKAPWTVSEIIWYSLKSTTALLTIATLLYCIHRMKNSQVNKTIQDSSHDFGQEIGNKLSEGMTQASSEFERIVDKALDEQKKFIETYRGEALGRFGEIGPEKLDQILKIVEALSNNKNKQLFEQLFAKAQELS